MIQKLLQLFRPKSETPDEPPREPPSTQAPAVPGGPEPDTLHPGRHRIKEVFTHHWDLDYLTEAELKALEQQSRE